MAASIFSFTSIKARSVLVPKSKFSRIRPAPSCASLSISFRRATWISCWRNGFTTVFSNSRAEVFCAEICTVISGMAISGSRDTGNVKYVTIPTIKHAVNAINTAMGRCIKNLTTPFIFYFQ